MASQNTGFKDLPVELVQEVAKHLNLQSTARLAQTSQGVHSALSHDLAKDKDKLIREALAPRGWYERLSKIPPDGAIDYIPDKPDTFPSFFFLTSCVVPPDHMPWHDVLPPQNMVIAVESGDIAKLEMYLRGGVDPNSYCLGGLRMLSIALVEAKFESIKALLKYGADVNRPDIGSRPWPDSVLSKVACGVGFWRSDPIVFDQIMEQAKISTWEMFICFRDWETDICIRILKTALRNGSDLANLRRPAGETTFHAAAKDRDLIDFVLSDIPELLTAKDDLQRSALFDAMAVFSDDKQIALYLIERGVDLDFGPVDNAIYMAIRKDQEEILRALICRPEFESMAAHGPLGTPIRYAFERRKFKTVHFLLDNTKTEVDNPLVNDMMDFYYKSKERCLRTDAERIAEVLEKLGINQCFIQTPRQ